MKEKGRFMDNFHPIKNQKGQSTTEYIIVVLFMFVAFLGKNPVQEQLQQTFQNKYKSYAFAVSVSDPPSAKFDHEVHETADTVKNIINKIKELIDKVENIASGDFDFNDKPNIENFEEFIENL